MPIMDHKDHIWNSSTEYIDYRYAADYVLSAEPQQSLIQF